MSELPILVVGSVAIDDVETPAGRRPESLGGSANYFSVSASLFAPVRLVGVVGDDFPEGHVQQLGERGIDLAGLEQVSGKTFRWRGRYASEGADAETLDTQLNVFETFQPKIPAQHRDTPVVFLGNIHPGLQSDVLDQIDAPRFSAADTMNFWIEGERDALCQMIRRLDMLIINETEASLLAEEKNVYDAADAIRALGPRIVVIKRGAYGAIIFHPEGLFVVPAYPLRTVIDPTGAGDTFAAGFMGSLAEQGAFDFAALKTAALYGTVMASFACEGFSMDGVINLERSDVEARVERLKEIMSF